MSEADNPTTPRKRSSHRPVGFGPTPSRDKHDLARESELPPDGAAISPLSPDTDPTLSSPGTILGASLEATDAPAMTSPAGADSSPTAPNTSAFSTPDLAASAAAVTEASVADLDTPLDTPEPIATADWVSRLTSEFEASTANGEWETQIQQIQEQNLRLQEQNRELLEQKAILDITLEETQAALQLQMTRSQNQETLLVQQAQALAESQTQTSSLYRDLELAQQTAQRQQIMIETLTEQLEGSQERIAQLEQDVATAQVHINEKVHALMQAEMTCRDLKTRLSRQQRYALQFKTALERCLDMPALRRSMFNASSTSTGTNPATDTTGEPDLSALALGNESAEALEDSSAERPHDHGGVIPALTHLEANLAGSSADLNLAEVSSHLHSLLNEAAASSPLEVSDAAFLASDLAVGDVSEEGVGDRDATIVPSLEADMPAVAFLSAREVDRASLDQVDEVPAEGAAAAPRTEARAAGPASPVAEAEVEAEASQAEGAPQAAPASQSPEVASFPADRMQAELWRRFNQWAAVAEVDESAAPPTVGPEAESPATPVTEPASVAEVVVPPLPTSSQRGIQPLRPSPQIPRFVSQWSEAVGRTSPAASQAAPVANQAAPVADEPSMTPVTSFTVSRRRPNDQPSPTPAQPQGEAMGTASEVKRGATQVMKRIELPDPQGESAAANQTTPVAEVSEADFQAMANWPSPLVYPLRSAKKRQSLAAIDLPNFARPHS